MKKNKKWKFYYRVSFEIVSHKDGLSVVSKRIGLKPSKGSCDIGDKRLGKKPGWKKVGYSYWRFFPALPKSASLKRHLDYLISTMEKSKAFKKGVLKKEYRVKVCIADFFNVNEIAAPGFKYQKNICNGLRREKLIWS